MTLVTRLVVHRQSIFFSPTYWKYLPRFVYDLARSEYAPSNSVTVVTNDWLESDHMLEEINVGFEEYHNVFISVLDAVQAKGEIKMISANSVKSLLVCRKTETTSTRAWFVCHSGRGGF